MAFREIPLNLDYSESNRQSWSLITYPRARPETYDFLFIKSQRYQLGTETPAPAQSAAGTVPPLRSDNYRNFAYNKPCWSSEQHFLLNLDTFITQQLPILNNHSPKKYRFALVGCHGVKGNYVLGYGHSTRALQTVGRILSLSNKFHFNFLLGDNVYHFGVTSPNSPLFQECFHSIFKNVECFAILGNHDYNMHSQAKISNLYHYDLPNAYRAMCQVYHSYLGKYDSIDLMDEQSTLNRWNMPFRYYALISKSINTVFICLDTNSFIFDEVQQKWLFDTYTKLKTELPNPNFILIAHHPFEYYSGRAFKRKPEWHKYKQADLPADARLPITPVTKVFNQELTDNQRQILENSASGSHANFDTIGHHLKYFLEVNNIRFNIGFFAHEHLLAYEQLTLAYYVATSGERWMFEQARFHQFISGGGGAELNRVDPRINTLRPFTRNPNNFAQSVNGYLEVALTKTELHTAFYEIEKGTCLHSINIELQAPRPSTFNTFTAPTTRIPSPAPSFSEGPLATSTPPPPEILLLPGDLNDESEA